MIATLVENEEIFEQKLVGETAWKSLANRQTL